MDKMYPTPICAITGRIFNGERLVGYIVTDANGKIQYLDTAVTWDWAVQNLIQNVKVVSKKDPSKGLTGTNGFELKKVEKIDQSKLADTMNAVTNNTIKADNHDAYAYLVRHSLKKDAEYNKMVQGKNVLGDTSKLDRCACDKMQFKLLKQLATDELNKMDIQARCVASNDIEITGFVYTDKSKMEEEWKPTGYVIHNLGDNTITFERLLWSECERSGKIKEIHKGEFAVVNGAELACILSAPEYSFRARNVTLERFGLGLGRHCIIDNTIECGVVSTCKTFAAKVIDGCETKPTPKFIRDMEVSESDIQDYFLDNHEKAVLNHERALLENPNYKLRLSTQDIQANILRHALKADDKFKQLRSCKDMDEVKSKMEQMAKDELVDKVPLCEHSNDLEIVQKLYDKKNIGNAGQLFGGRSEIGYLVQNNSDRPVKFIRVLWDNAKINSAEVGIIPPHERKALNRVELAILLSNIEYSFTISNARLIFQKYVIRGLLKANNAIGLVQALKKSYAETDPYDLEPVLINTVESKDNIKKYFYDSGKDLTGISKQESNPVGKVNTSVGTVNTTVGNTSTADKKNKSNFGQLMSKYGKR